MPTRRTFLNPVIPGFASDPSICRVGEDYYLITSTLEYFPGMPVFHSRDLVHWRCLGHIRDRPSQLDLDRAGPMQGLYAPTIRHYDGVFYAVTTVRTPDGEGFRDDNFIVSTTDPAGDWSEPVTLVDEPGIIDPTLFFDDDGRAWYAANMRIENEPYPGYRDIWLQELDLKAMELIGERTLLWNGALKEAGAPEAPHIYKVDGTYYLMLAEGAPFTTTPSPSPAPTRYTVRTRAMRATPSSPIGTWGGRHQSPTRATPIWSRHPPAIGGWSHWLLDPTMATSTTSVGRPS